MNNIKILIACEESQRISTQFRERGFEAYSCDIQECSGGHPEFHIMQDVLPLLNGNCEFTTMDGIKHKIEGKWDLIIAHPNCQDLSVSGALRFEQKRKDGRQRESIEFFCKMLTADCEHICVENPINIISGDYIKKWFPDLCEKYGLPVKYSQIIQPYEYGDPESKRTCLWLKGLPILQPTNILPLPECGHWANQTKDGQNKLIVDGKWIGYNDPRTKKYRAKTYPGIAKAIADQWSDYLINLNNNGGT